MKRFLIIVVFAMWIVGFVSVIRPETSTPHDASVGTNITWTTYYVGNQAYGKMAQVDAGSAHLKFRAHILCSGSDGYRYGPWQTQPGPWYGSAVYCTAGHYVASYGLQWG